jgi:hypothetical protein
VKQLVITKTFFMLAFVAGLTVRNYATIASNRRDFVHCTMLACFTGFCEDTRKQLRRNTDPTGHISSHTWLKSTSESNAGLRNAKMTVLNAMGPPQYVHLETVGDPHLRPPCPNSRAAVESSFILE